jgi:membrane carboxypeptidase/penicillin-binding protein PbpC
MRAGEACPIRSHEWLPQGFSPLPCSWHHATEDGLLTIWPDEYRTWAAGRGLLERDQVVAVANRAPVGSVAPNGQAVARRFEITMPPDGATYLIDPTLRKEFQAIPLRAAGDNGRLEWTVDGRLLSQGSNQAISWPLERGTHVVRARDARGRVAESAILVK